jgi:hypothetical protein
MTRAQSCINRRLKQLHIAYDPLLMGDLFDSIIGASGSYGCEIWSTSFLGDWHFRGCSLQRYHTATLKRSLGVRSSTSNHLAYFQAGRLPMQVGWMSRTVGYWNKLVANQANSQLLAETLKANIHFGLTEGVSCWSKELHDGLKFVMPDVDWHDHLTHFRSINANTIKQAATHKFHLSLQHFTHDPVDPACPNRYHNMYHQWMFLPPVEGTLAPPAYLTSTNSLLRAKQATARIRLNNAPIRCNIDHGLDYNSRLCTRCNSNQIDHEAHFLLECTGLAGIRDKECYAELLAECTNIQDLMQAAYEPESSRVLTHFFDDILNDLHGLIGHPSHRQ